MVRLRLPACPGRESVAKVTLPIQKEFACSENRIRQKRRAFKFNSREGSVMTSDEKLSRPFVSGHSRARLVVIFLALNIAFDLVSAASLLLQAQLLLKVQEGDTVTQAEALSNDSRQQLISWLQMGVYVVTAILFLMWIHRAYRNLKALGVRTTTYSP